MPANIILPEIMSNICHVKIFACLFLGLDMASAFIGILALMDAKALVGFAMPDRASVFVSKNNKNVLNADVLAGITKPAGASASIRVSILTNVEAMSGFVPKDPQGLLDAYS